MNYILLQTIGLGEQWVNTTTMGFPDMVIVGMGLRSDSVKRFPNKLSYNEIFKMNSSVWRDVRSRNGSRSGIVGLREGNRVWRVSPDKSYLREMEFDVDVEGCTESWRGRVCPECQGGHIPSEGSVSRGVL